MNGLAKFGILIFLLIGAAQAAVASEKQDAGGVLQEIEHLEEEKQPWIAPDKLRESPAEYVTRLRKGAEAGDPKAQATLGTCYATARGTPRDFAKAFEWYEKAAAKGHAGAQNNLGVMYDLGVGVAQDTAKAKELYASAAQAGLADAEFNVGLNLVHENKFEEGRKWYEKAAGQGHLRALNNLGRMYFIGQGVPVDMERAKSYLTKPAEAGFGTSQLSVALAFFAQENLSEGMVWLRRSLRTGYVGADWKLAEMLYSGQGMERNVTAALDLARKAANRGYPNAQALLARILLGEADKMRTDPKEAYESARKSAEKGNSYGQRLLGSCYYRGFGVERNATEAIKWYRLATEQKDEVAACNLAELLESGTGTPRDIPEAVKWYRIGAEAGDPRAQAFYAIYLRDGKSVERDVPAALDWARKSAKSGLSQAAVIAAQILIDSTGIVPPNPSEAYHLARQAADQGNPPGQRLVGLCYHRGIGVERDVNEAMKWYRLAAEQHDAVAASNLGVLLTGGKTDSPNAEAERWLRTSVESGDAHSQYVLALSFFQGMGVKRDLPAGLEWARKSAKSGSAEGAAMVASVLLDRILKDPANVPVDSSEAYHSARQAADQGNAFGQSLVGNCYHRGVGVERDLKEAIKWYRLAAEQKNIVAASNLGKMYKSGEAGSPDPVEAVKWFRVGAEGGDYDSRRYLAVMLVTGEGVARDVPTAVNILRPLALDASHGPDLQAAAQRALAAAEKMLAQQQGYQEGKRIFSMPPAR